ncbi:hypothetical protein [Streptomyces lutosisoli]|uniref:HTH cro/C1-type domain-containing protein n=1 Tax=Streptomyces lutosisoli TaxID=2665721 RepID=A0ABW2VVY3_9ACTN
MSEIQRNAARHIEEPWCVELRQITETISRKDLALIVGMSKSKLQQFLGGHVKPNMDDTVRLAEALNYPKLRLLSLCGYLDGLSNLLSYLDQIEEQAERMDFAAKQLPGDPLSGATRIANSALAEGNFEVVMRPVFQGTGSWRRHYADHVVLRLLQGGAISRATRDRVEAALYDELTWFGAGFTEGWIEGVESLTINVPRFVALRRGTGAPLPGVPRSIAVVGGHWAGSADVASFLGYAFGCDYSHVAFVASRAFSQLNHRYDDSFRDRDRLEVTRTYVEGGDLGRMRVWAADTGDSEAVAKIIATSRARRSPLVVYLRPTDELLAWAAHVRSNSAHTPLSATDDLSRSRAVREKVDEVLHGIQHKTLVLNVSTPPGVHIAPGAQATDTPHGFLNMWAELAVQAVTEMRVKFHLPFDQSVALQRLGDGKAQV